jgi:hypothetical protein
LAPLLSITDIEKSVKMTSFGKWSSLKLIIGFSIAKIDNYPADWQKAVAF